MRTYIFYILLIGLLSNAAFGQEVKKEKLTDKALALMNKLKLEKANEHYNRLAYFHAVPLYEELAASAYKTREIFPKLGDCYYNLSNMEKAETMYSQVVLMDSIDPVYYYKYAQVLRSNGKYADSEIWMTRYRDNSKADSRVKSFSENKDAFTKLAGTKGSYFVKERKDLNSVFADFGAVSWNNKMVFTSGRTDNMLVGTYYAWNDKPFLDLYQFDSSAIALKKIKLFGNKINSKFHEGPVCFADSGKTIYFTRNNYLHGKRTNSAKGTTHLLLFKAQLTKGKWGSIKELPFNNKEYSVGHPSITADGNRLYFTSNMPGSFGGTDIYYVDIIGDNQYGTPINLGPTINTEGNEMFPFIDEAGLYFSTDGHIGFGGLDLFFAKSMMGGQFAKPSNIGLPVNSPRDDFSFFLNNDKRSGYLASNRIGGTGDDDIYEFSLNQLVLLGTVRDTSEQNKALEKAKVVLTGKNGEIIDTFLTDANGKYQFNVAFDQDYLVRVAKLGYVGTTKSVSTKGIQLSEITANLNLGKDRPFILLGKITDKKTGASISDVELTIVDTLKQSLILDTKTAADGLFRTQLANVQMKSHLAYRIMLRKGGYLAKTVIFDHYVLNYETNLNEFLEVSLDKIAVGVDIGKLLNINPIYFDLGKWDIRADAALELNKIVQAMKDNPTVVIELGSHTDARGSNQANFDLSDKRAKASAEYIISQGIDTNRIYGKGYGESRLVNRCKDGVKCKEEEHAQNRRTEFKVVKF